MSFPKIRIRERQVILLSGFKRSDVQNGSVPSDRVADLPSLLKAADQHRDAVAFGYVEGRWMPSA